MTSVQKLSRIVLICRQAERLAEFYIRAFRFACIEDSPKIDPGFAELIGLAKGQVRITSLRLGNQEIALAETQRPRMAPSQAPPRRNAVRPYPFARFGNRHSHSAGTVADGTAEGGPSASGRGGGGVGQGGARACIQLGGVRQGTEQNQTRNTVL